ncbi:SDR family oxidoreductase [Nonomuraea sp. NPDC003804]|uniref:SDR family oxidoreductase n=1 Tax=Nonomuraea sp. NPDC003804 TaxID=3154547 RepID=UPI0033A592EB
MTWPSGCVAMVTGAARGVGRAVAVAFAEAGADLVLLDVCADLPGCPYPMSRPDQLAGTARRCGELGARVVTIEADVRDLLRVEEGVAGALAEFGRIDVLVNNAGIVGPAGVLAHEMAEADWNLLLDVNVTGAWQCARSVLPAMVERRSGSVVNIASTAGHIAFRSFSGYVTAKHALIGLTKALAVDYAPYGIRVNAVSPTSVYEDPGEGPGMLAGVATMMGTGVASYEEVSHALHPLNTLAYAEDVAAATLWLASPAAARCTGTILPVDAGFTIR